MKTIILSRNVALTILLAMAVSAAYISRTHAAILASLQSGDSGAAVTELQTFLATDVSVYPEGLVTGFYGPLTVSAVQRFQCKYGIVCSGDAATTGYGRVGPATLNKIASLNGAGSIPGGADIWAPILSKPVAATTSNSATITWSTSEPSTSRVMYGTVWPFLYAAAPSVASASVDASPRVTLSNLLPNTTYFYVLESHDMEGNLQYGIGNSFKTSM